MIHGTADRKPRGTKVCGLFLPHDLNLRNVSVSSSNSSVMDARWTNSNMTGSKHGTPLVRFSVNGFIKSSSIKQVTTPDGQRKTSKLSRFQQPNFHLTRLITSLQWPILTERHISYTPSERLYACSRLRLCLPVGNRIPVVSPT